MKTKVISLLVALLFATSSYSQIKVFSGGSVTIGATTSPTVNAVMHQIIGAKTVFPSSTSAITSAPLIQGNNGYSSASSPDFTWYGDVQTGLFHRAANELNISVANSEKFRLNSSNQLLSVNTTSSASTPDFSWYNDANTGMFHPSNDILGFTANGYEVFRASNSTGQPQIMYSNSTSLYYIPDYSWSSDNNTGMFRQAADKIGFSTGGTEKFRINDNGQLLNLNGPASASYPDFSWGGDSNTGIFNAGSDILGFSTGGTERMRINSSGRLLINTTTDDAFVSVTTGDHKAAFFDITHSADWMASMVTEVDRGNSVNYVVTKNGTTNFYVAGDGWIYAGGTYLGSDKNIKDDINAIDSATAKINKLNGVTYKLKKEKQNPTDYPAPNEYMGLIAQDVEAVAPQVVKTMHDGTKAVCYEMLVGLLVEALKEQNGKIAQLQSDVNNCCNKNNDRLISPEQENENGSINKGSYIKQNAPNPFSNETTIEYYIAEKNTAASILVFDMNGKLLKTYKLNGSGQGNLVISGNELTPGMYYYSLIINNKEIDTKKMILTE